ncbi:MAG: hypothetical protein AAF974_05410 [Cyanobacteria bacterium P01_E01_bin.34]
MTSDHVSTIGRIALMLNALAPEEARVAIAVIPKDVARGTVMTLLIIA